MTERIGWTCGNCGGPVTGPYAECENCGRKPERIGMLNTGSSSIEPGFPLSSTVSVGILVRVQWPLDDDPQNKALKWLTAVLAAGCVDTYARQIFTKDIVSGITIDPDTGHGTISIRKS